MVFNRNNAILVLGYNLAHTLLSLPHVFLPASFLERLELFLAKAFPDECFLVENRKAADLLELGRLRKMADGSRRGAEFLEQVAESLFCFCRGQHRNGRYSIKLPRLLQSISLEEPLLNLRDKHIQERQQLTEKTLTLADTARQPRG